MGDKSKILRSGPTYMPSGDPATLIHTNANNTALLVRQLTITNVTETPSSFSVWLNATDPVVTGPTDDAAIFRNKVLQAGEIFNFYFSPGLRMERTEYLIGLATDASVITYSVGWELILTDFVD